MKKVLVVVGGGGYVGSVLVGLLCNSGHAVKVLDRFIYGKDSISGYGLSSPACEGDVRCIHQFYHLLDGVDVVVHLGELVGDALCDAIPAIAIETNLVATAALAHACGAAGVKQMIYTSSCSVYGACQGDGDLLTEKSPLNPLSLYASLKAHAETAILGAASQHPGTNYNVLRLGTICGVSQRPRFDLVVNFFVAEACHKGKIIVHGGSQWRPFVHVQDVARAILLLAESPTSNFIMNIVGFNMTIDGLAREVRKIVPTDIEHVPTSGDMRNYRVSGDTAKSAIGFYPEWTLPWGIRELSLTVQSYQDYQDAKYNNGQCAQWFLCGRPE